MIVPETAKQYSLHVIGNIIRAGGQLTTPEHAEARKLICEGCPLYGEVEPLPGLKTIGCTKCGCTGSEKQMTLTYRAGLRKFKKETCPHPDGNLWADVDKRFEKHYKTSK